MFKKRTFSGKEQSKKRELETEEADVDGKELDHIKTLKADKMIQKRFAAVSKEAAKASMPRTEHGQTETINFGLQPKAQQGILSKHAETHEKLLEKFITDNISSSQSIVPIVPVVETEDDKLYKIPDELRVNAIGRLEENVTGTSFAWSAGLTEVSIPSAKEQNEKSTAVAREEHIRKLADKKNTDCIIRHSRFGLSQQANRTMPGERVAESDAAAAKEDVVTLPPNVARDGSLVIVDVPLPPEVVVNRKSNDEMAVQRYKKKVAAEIMRNKKLL